MRLITWNCQGAFRKKAASILSYNPDILVVQESEHPDKLDLNSATKRPNNLYWHGDNIHKGIGIYSYSDYKFELLPTFNPEFRYILPFRVTGQGQTFILFAIWAMNNKENYQARYIGQIWLAINHYADLLGSSTILIGDFNSNKIWDYKDRVGNHSDVVRKLADNNINSIYHRHFEFEQGKEKHPTFFLQRKQNKSYHIDYCFASADIIDKVQNIGIGTYENWIEHSDHSPLIIDFAF
ncbi:MAG: endonuclease/exonuclease/phosphatase family protein [Bacteroidia bacterium]|nr:endonuclease/exonuclease/phosphatase family protein [Bacteroidia bacterium]